MTLEEFKRFLFDTSNKAYRRINRNNLWLHDGRMDVGGGRITIANIDKLKDYPEVKTVTISGLTQETFEYFIKNYGEQFHTIRFFKNKMVEDWSLLGTLPNLEYVFYFHNQRITSLWDMSGNDRLRGISLSGFTRLKSLAGVEKAPNLEWFEITDCVNGSRGIETLNCFAGTNIQYLSYGGYKIDDDEVSFLKDLPQLEEYDFLPNLYTTEQVAWMVANYPNVKGKSMCATRTFMSYDEEEECCNVPYIEVVGKRKPSFQLEGNEKRLKKVEDHFESLVNQYRGVEPS